MENEANERRPVRDRRERRSRSRDRRGHRSIERDGRRDSDGRSRNRDGSRERSRDRGRDRSRERLDRNQDRNRERSRERNDRNRTTVRIQRPPSPALADPVKRAQRSVFVSQISAQLKSRDLSAFLAPSGRIREVRLVEDKVSRRSKGVAYVEFYEEASVARAIALTGTLLFGIPIIIQGSECEKNNIEDYVALEPRKTIQLSNKLFVEALPSIVTEQDLKDLFEPFGRLDLVNLHIDAATAISKGYAFVHYKHTNDARDAVRSMDGFDLMGSKVSSR